ncbi:MAG: dihydroneopterin aldolase [Actinomycetota bacterium]|nr:dihydroneopterin aldolase [Actinomycetota bacterium]
MNPNPIIRLRGITLYTHHGVGEAEREIGQRMIFDLDLLPVSCEATATDDVADTIDYGEVTGLVVDLATGRSFHTLERLVTVIAETVLDRFPAESVTVRATKPVPPVPVTMDGASVEVTMRRNGPEEGA